MRRPGRAFAAAAARAACRARWRLTAWRTAACRAAASLALSSCADLASPVSRAAAPVRVRAAAADPANEASAMLADAAGDVPGQATTAPAAMPARASAEPAAMIVTLGVLR